MADTNPRGRRGASASSRRDSDAEQAPDTDATAANADESAGTDASQAPETVAADPSAADATSTTEVATTNPAAAEPAPAGDLIDAFADGSVVPDVAEDTRRFPISRLRSDPSLIGAEGFVIRAAFDKAGLIDEPTDGEGEPDGITIAQGQQAVADFLSGTVATGDDDTDDDETEA